MIYGVHISTVPYMFHWCWEKFGLIYNFIKAIIRTKEQKRLLQRTKKLKEWLAISKWFSIAHFQEVHEVIQTFVELFTNVVPNLNILSNKMKELLRNL